MDKFCRTGANFLSYHASVPLTTLSQHLWFNRHIKRENNRVYFSDFSNLSYQ